VTRIVRRPIARLAYDWSSRRLGWGNPDPRTNGEHLLLDLLPPAPTVLDVGAHHGDYAVEVLSRRPAATVHCLEPGALAFAELERRVGGRAFLHQVAAGAVEGEAPLHANRPAPRWRPSTGATSRRSASRSAVPWRL
jgi:hypothetical protein